MQISQTDRLLALVAEFHGCGPKGLHLSYLDAVQIRGELQVIADRVRQLELAHERRFVPVTRPAPLLRIPRMDASIPCLAANAP